MTDERSIERQNGSFCETILWNARDKLDPPYKGYVMFASSSPDTNVPHLLEKGYSEDDIVIVEYDDHETIWVPEDIIVDDGGSKTRLKCCNGCIMMEEA